MARRLLLLPALVIVALTTGCGAVNSDSSGDFKDKTQRAVARAVEDFSDAAQKRDWAEVCDDRLSTELARALATAAKGKCQDRVEDSLRDADSFDVDVTAVKVTGSSAIATVKTDVRSGTDPVDLYTLVDQDGAWRISAISAPAAGTTGATGTTG